MIETIKQAWAETERTGLPVSIGDTVICDACDQDCTDLPDEGGLIFTSSAYCPTCATTMLPRIQGYGEERFIRARCPEGVSFAAFVRTYRGPNNFVQVIAQGDA